MELTKGQVTQVAYDTVQAYNRSIGHVRPSWAELPQDIKEEVIGQTEMVEENPKVTPEDLHNRWKENLEAKGWEYKEDEEGNPIDRPNRKKHPYLKPFDELPEEVQVKSKLLLTVIKFFLPEEVEEPKAKAKPKAAPKKEKPKEEVKEEVPEEPPKEEKPEKPEPKEGGKE